MSDPTGSNASGGGPAAFRVRSSRSVAEAAFLELVEHEVEGPDGEVFTRFTVTHPGAVVVAPVEDGSVVMVRQFRVATGRDLLELPAGKREVGEDPEVTAGREMEEEVGLRPGRLVKLAEFYNSPGFCDEYTHVYLGLDLIPARSADELKAEERHLSIERVPLDHFDDLVARGDIVDAKTLVGVTLARRYLGGEYGGFSG